MIDYNEMVKNESMEDVILFLVARRESGLIYPAIDRFFYRHNGPDKYESCNIMILRETHRLLNEEKIMCGGEKGGLYMKGPKWVKPGFMSEGKYEIDKKTYMYYF